MVRLIRKMIFTLYHTSCLCIQFYCRSKTGLANGMKACIDVSAHCAEKVGRAADEGQELPCIVPVALQTWTGPYLGLHAMLRL